MKFFTKLSIFIFIFSMSSIHCKQTTQATPRPTVQIKPVQAPSQPATAQQPRLQARSYADALNIIKTQMPSNKILVNNTFTQEFIDFVKSLNLSPIETKALLQAGANIHTTWTDNNETNKKILLSLTNTIQAITQSKSTKQTKSAKHISPIKPQAAITQAVPIKKEIPPKSTVQTTPIQKAELIQQAKPMPEHFITNNLIITLDPNRSESVDTQGGAMVQQVLAALHEKAAPIIMTSNIFEIIIKAKQQIGDNDLQKLRNVNLTQGIPLAQSLRQSHNLTIIGDLLLILLSSIEFNSNTINCYFHKSANLVLLIPKQYIYNNLSKAINFNLYEQATVCGFNPAVLEAITDFTADNLLKKLHAMPIDREKFIPHLTSMFRIQKKNGHLISPSEDTPWMIYLTGHGGPAHLSVGFVRQQLKIIQQNLSNTRKFPVKDPKIQRLIPIWESNVKQYEKMLQGKSTWPESQIVPESALIAGITAREFAQLMTFFDESINTAYVHYTTCFSGGSNQTFVNETLSSLNVHFIVSSEGQHEGYTRAQLEFIISNKPGIQLQNRLFSEFFRLLRIFFTKPEEFVKIKEKRKDPIIKIIRTISPESIQQNQPFVRFPGAGFFAATPLSKKTKVLTQTIVKAHEIENKPIDISTENVDVLIINTPRITVPLNLGKKRTSGHTALTTPSPKSFLPAYESIHVFKEINWQDTLQSLLFNCTYLNAKLYPQTFVINTLTGIFLQQSGLPGKQGASIKNLIIHMKGVSGIDRNSNRPPMQFTPLTGQALRSSTVGLNVNVTFELNENIYQCSFAIQDFERSDELYKNMEKLTFTATPKQTINMNSLASIFLTPQEIAQLTKPITLNSIAKYIDDKIDKQDPSMAIWSEANKEALLQFTTKRTK